MNLTKLTDGVCSLRKVTRRTFSAFVLSTLFLITPHIQAATFELIVPPITESAGSVDLVFRVSATAAETAAGGSCAVFGSLSLGSSQSPLPVAEEGSDYSPVPPENFDILIFQASGDVVEEATLTVPIVNDQLVEPVQEALSLNFFDNSEGGDCFGTPVPSSLSEIVVINDDDALLYSFNPASSTISENSGPINIDLTLDNPQDAPFQYSATIPVSAQSGSATAGSDFLPFDQNLVFNEAQIVNSASIDLIDDNEIEQDEVFQIANASAPSAVDGAGNPVLVEVTNASLVTLTSDDVPDTLAMTSANLSVDEDSGSVDISVLRTGTLAGVVSVSYATAEASATAPDDFESASGTLTFEDGQAGPLVISVPLTDDLLNEPTESFDVQLDAVQGAAVLGLGSTQVEIIDNDLDALGFSVAVVSVGEETASVTLEVVRTGSALDAVSVDFQTQSGSALEGSDFSASSGLLTFAAGEFGPQQIVVELLDDALVEDEESFDVVLSNATGAVALTTAVAVITLVDDDIPQSPSVFEFVSTSQDVAEDDGELVLSVRRSGDLSEAASVDYQTLAGTALAGEDFTSTTGTLNFSANEAGPFDVIVSILDDTDSEGSEEFTVSLLNAVGGAISGANGEVLVAIIDNDTGATDVAELEFASEAVNVDEDEGSVELEVVRNGSAIGAVSVDWATVADSALASEDFVAASGTLNWSDGDTTSRTITVDLTTDVEIEGVEEFSLELNNPQGGVLGAQSVASIVVSDVGQDLQSVAGLSAQELELAQVVDASCDNLIENADANNADQQDLLFICGTVRNGLETTDQVRDALDALSGDELITAATSTLKLLGLQQNTFRNRLSVLRSGNAGTFDVSGLAVEIDGQYLSGAVLEEVFGALTGGAAGDDSFGRLSFYINGKLDFGEKDIDSANQGYDFDSQSLTFGADYRLNDKAFIGAAIGYEKADVDFAQGGALDVDGWKGSVYGSYFSGDAFYVDVQASYGKDDYRSERRITYDYVGGSIDRTAEGDTDGNQFSSGIASGWDFNRGRLTFGPNVAFSYFDVGVDSFVEDGAGGLNLAIGRQNQQSLTFTGGAHLSYVINTKLGVLIPHARIDYVHEFLTSPEFASVRFASDAFGANPSSIAGQLQVQAETIDQDYLLWSVGTSLQMVHGLSGYVTYQTTEGYSGLKLQQIAYGMRLEKTY